MTLVAGRITDFMERITGLPREQARAIQKSYSKSTAPRWPG